MNRALLAAAVVALGAGAGAWWLTRPATAPAPAVAAPAAKPGVGALGRVDPAGRVRKLSQPGGFAVNRVARLLVEEGEAVAEGQILAELSDAAQKDAAIVQADAVLAEARASLAKTLAAARPSEIAAQEARIAALAAMEDMARRDADRADALLPSGAGNRAQAERNRAAAARAAAEKTEAAAHLETIRRPSAEDVAVAEARVLSAEASVRRARADAELARIRAPSAGTILRILARPGDQVGADGLLEIADLTRLDVVADVHETDLPRVVPGARATVAVPGDPVRYGATVRDIGWTIRRTTQAGTDPVAAVDARSVEVRLTLDPPGRDALRRRVGMQVQVAIQP